MGAALEKSRAHYRRGIKLFGDEEFKAALAEFMASQALRSHWRTLYNIATCHGRLGDYVTAIRYYERALKHVPLPPIARRRSIMAEMKRLQSLLAIVRLDLNVAKATLVVSGVKREVTNGETFSLPSGIHVFELSAPGHGPERQKVTLTGGTVSTVQFTLRQGTRLRVESNASGAQVYMDGAEAGRTPYEVDIAPRTVNLRVQSAGRIPWQGQVTGKPGETVQIQVDLDDPKKGLKQYWFWTAAGAALAMSATALALGLKVRSYQSDYDAVVQRIQTGDYQDIEELDNLKARGNSLQQDLRQYSAGTNTAIGLSAAAAVTTLVLSFFTRFRTPKSRAKVVLAVQYPGGASLEIGGVFP
jgi:tetratricopeptide (TPR) repeat protein